jgi:OPA family glycerol-3-phosphate transporter-like MFS transporter/OPA family sugar phosphate sensor protein UhpC-like MFS transporter
VGAHYRYWRWRQLYSTFIGYAVFYFVRKNLSCAFPLMEKDLHIGKAEMGGFLTAHGILYGISKFLNGMLGDRSNARAFMVFGLVTSALANYAFGFSSGVWLLGLLWVLNGWFQGMGFPPCARVLSHWFAPSERGVKWGLWNTSHQVGGAVILVLGGYLGQHYGWRAIFWGPATIALIVSLFLWNRLRDTPASLGLPEVEVFTGEPVPPRIEQPFWETLRSRVFTNPYIWAICFANFFVYVVRYVFFDWWPTYLHQQRDFTLSEAGRLTAMFEVAGLIGSLAAGYLSDRWLHGKRNPVCLGYLLATFGCILGYWYLPKSGFWAEAAAVSLVGFFIYGPQFLVGVMVTDLASKEAAASAIGLTGFFGYLSGVASGWGLGCLVELYGWNASFIMTLICTVGAFVCFAVCGRKT